MLLLYQFWLTEICICCKPCPTRDKMHDLQIALPMTLTLPFFYTFGTLHARHIRAIFKLWGRPLVKWPTSNAFNITSCFFLSVFLWKEFNSHSFIVTFHFSCSPPVFYPALDDCRIHVNVGCHAYIYSTLLAVSLNDEPWLAHWRQQSAGSAFQFHYTMVVSIQLYRSWQNA